MVTINEKTYTKFLSEEFCDENISSLAIKNIYNFSFDKVFQSFPNITFLVIYYDKPYSNRIFDFDFNTLQKLVDIALSGLGFKQIPLTLYKIERLESITLFRTTIREFPSYINSSVSSVKISQNHFTEMDSIIESVPNLRVLEIIEEAITNLSRLNELKKLWTLNLYYLEISHLPKKIDFEDLEIAFYETSVNVNRELIKQIENNLYFYE
jgi:Leucine-rich repeat (LRR) protein